MAHVKAGGTSKNNRDSQGQRLGVKRSGGQKVRAGEILVRQVGQNKLSGKGTFLSKNYTIHAAKDGTVNFTKKRKKNFAGKTVPRTEVTVN
jgi:large subunit ribosomal protein L27